MFTPYIKKVGINPKKSANGLSVQIRIWTIPDTLRKFKWIFSGKEFEKCKEKF